MKTITFDEAKYKLVPIEPSQEMLNAGCEAGLAIEVLMDDTPFSCDRAVYQAMVEKAPAI